MVQDWGTGKPDYSMDVQRSVAPTMLTTTKTKPGTQASYWATASVNVPQYSAAGFVIELGFDSSNAFVPAGKRLSLERVEITGARNTLLKAVVATNDGTTTTTIGQKYGYQNTTLEVGKWYVFPAGQRPYYTISNYDTASTVTFTVNAYGIVEDVE